MVALEIIENINRINEEFHRQLDGKLQARLNINLTDFLVLNTLDRILETTGKSGVKQEKIVEFIEFNKSTVSRRLKDAEAQGLIRRMLNARSEREKLVSLTKSGKQMLADARQLISSHVQDTTSHVEDFKQQQLLVLLAELASFYDKKI